MSLANEHLAAEKADLDPNCDFQCLQSQRPKDVT